MEGDIAVRNVHSLTDWLRAVAVVLLLAWMPFRTGSAIGGEERSAPQEASSLRTRSEADLSAPSLLVHTIGLVRLEAALAPFLLRLASGESTAPGLTFGGPAWEMPNKTADEMHGDQAHGSPGPEGRLGMLAGSILKIPANRLPHFLDRDGEVLLVGFAPDSDQEGWTGGVLLPVRHLDELVRSWKEHEVVRHLVREVGEQVYRMDYPRYGPFFITDRKSVV